MNRNKEVQSEPETQEKGNNDYIINTLHKPLVVTMKNGAVKEVEKAKLKR